MQNLYQEAKRCFLTANPDDKIALTYQTCAAWQANKLSWRESSPVELLNEPGRLSKPEIVMPRDIPKRKLNKEVGRAALIHALAHIELTAVNLAWDSVYRYRDMPKDYYQDWVQCAQEEAEHFSLLRMRLREMGYDYGSFPAHDELWKMAVTTADDLTDRMAIVHRVFEARALDVIPATLTKFQAKNDTQMVKILTQICNEEVGHVSSGTRWFRYRCEQAKLNPDTHFIHLIEQYMKQPLSGPFNHEARLASGFSQNELNYLEQSATYKHQG
ncbi:ferritin-like domain-containing protein [Marinomonas sp. PE14-40]|uniref:ferritin-like domain-containing protein n=1 Tax=Marinomonas sp. PE14-40 TaxID=3060621 RepID=UPI003F66E7CF